MMPHLGFGWVGGLSLLLHGLFCFLFGLGLVFLVIWAARVMDKKALTKWTVILLVVGLVGGILSAGFMFWKAPEVLDSLQWRNGKGCIPPPITTETKPPVAAPVVK